MLFSPSLVYSGSRAPLRFTGGVVLNLQALRFHAPLTRTLRSPRSGGVISLHDRALNLLLDGGEVVSLLMPELGNGPGAILLPRLPGWRHGDQVTAGAGRIAGPGATVLLQGGSPWTPPKPPRAPQRSSRTPPDPGPALARLAERGSRSGLLPAVLTAMGHATAPLTGTARALHDLALPGLDLLAQKQWKAAVSRLAGLGPGLTPSGDDLLGGYLSLLRRTGSRRAAGLAAATRALPVTATGPLSLHLLRWAAQGVAGEHHLSWLDALLAGDDEPHLAQLLAHGATSGADWAAGALLALEHSRSG